MDDFMKTIAVSKETYKKLIELKEEFDTPNMDDALDKLLSNYKALLKKISLKELLELNKKETKINVEELLEDRRRYGWPRNLY
jgi:predicted CopG family antitoxin